MHLQSLHIETEITEEKKSQIWLGEDFGIFTLQTFPVCKIGTRGLDPMVGFWEDFCKMAQDEHLTPEHFSFRSTILSITMFIFKLTRRENSMDVSARFSKQWSRGLV